MSAENPLDRHFSRRLKAAVEGLHLPSEEELLRGMSFFRGDLDEDIREYAERLSRRVRKRGDRALVTLAVTLEELTVEQSNDGVQCLMKVLNGVEEVEGIPVKACRLRCRFGVDKEGSVMVFTSVGNDATSEGKRVVKEFETFVRRTADDGARAAARMASRASIQTNHGIANSNLMTDTDLTVHPRP